MGTGYTRNDTANNIADGNIINAADLDGEFDAVEAAFNSSTGHTHDGTAAEGGAITVLGPSQEFVASATEVKPSTNGGLNLGTNLLQFNNLWLDGTANIDSLVADTADINGGTIDGTVIGGSTPAAGSFTTGSFTGDVSFGDNDKAIFGAGSDLQIYHDGTNSYISDQGTGSLRILAEDFRVRNAANNESMITALDGGSVFLYDSSDLKLNTTSTGIDVTGTVTADGLDLGVATDGATVSNTASDYQLQLGAAQSTTNDIGRNISFGYSGVTTAAINTIDAGASNAQDLAFYTGNGTAISERLRISSGGDISFYEDTGTTPALTWDASAQSLDVDGPITADGLTVASASLPKITISDTDGGFDDVSLTVVNGGRDLQIISPQEVIFRDAGTAANWLRIDEGDISFYEDTGTTPKFFWDASAESLGIGTSSPAQKLDIVGDATSATIELKNTAGQGLNLTGGSSGVDIKTPNVLPITFGTSNTERMRIDSSGNVNIGLNTGIPTGGTSLTGFNTGPILSIGATDTGLTTSEIAGSIAFITSDSSYTGTYSDGITGEIASVAETSVGGGYGLAFYTGVTTNSDRAERVRIDYAGNVGIGTSSPRAPLHLEPSGAASDDFNLLVSQFRPNIVLEDLSTSATDFQLFVDGNDLQFRYGDASTDTKLANEAMRIDSSGSVGIGTSSPQEKLHLIGSAKLDFGSAGGNPRLYFDHDTVTDDANYIQLNRGDAGLEIVSEDNIKFDTNGSEAMQIDSSRRLLFGTTDTSMWDNSSGGATGIVMTAQGRIEAAAESGDCMRLNRMGTDGGIAFFYNDGSNVGNISVSGSATSYNTSSDYRLKTDAQPMTGASARVQALNPVNFEWIADGTRVDGFLAHEAQAVVPEAVTGTKDAVDADGNPEYQGIDQSKLVPLLTAALQEALTKIDALEARITTLENN